jgi:tetratricopeptide (TPR) repeat protein
LSLGILRGVTTSRRQPLKPGGGASEPPRRRGRPLLIGAVLGAATLALLAAASVARVPAGLLGFTRGGVLLPGWHLRIPFQRVRLEPREGRLEAVEFERRTGEGALVTVRMSFDYHFDIGVTGGASPLAGGEAVRGLVARLAGEALAPLPRPGWVSDDLTAGGGAPLPLPAERAIVEALRGHGLAVCGFTAREAPSGTWPRISGTPAPEAARAVTAEGGMPPVEPRGVRLLMIGLDGADWDSIDPLVHQGRMPNLARLIARGVRAPLRSYDPMISPLLWTTMVTGVGPDVHGVADFQAIDETTGRRVPITSRFRKVKAAWNILSDASLASDFVAWWASYPAERVDGVQVSNLIVYESLRPKPPGAPVPPGITYPPDYFAAIRPRLRTAADLSYDEIRPILHIGRGEFESARADVLKPPAPAEDSPDRRLAQKPVSLAITILTGTKNYATIAADLARRHDPLTAVYFEGIDMMGHRFQHCMPPRTALCPAEDYARYRDAVTSFYELQDRLLGPILDAAGPGATVLVVSDHGFKTGSGRPSVLPFTTQQPVEWHDENGIFLLSGPGARRGERLSSLPTLFDIMPTLLYLVGLPAAGDMPGRVLLEALDPSLAARGAPRAIASYEPLGRAREVAPPGGEDAREAERELLANLRALGYIGADSSAPSGADAAAAGASKEGAAARADGGDAREKTQVFYHRNLANYFLKRREYGKAVDQLRLANQREKLPKNYQMLSEAYFGLGKTAEAIAALEEGFAALKNMDPESVLWMVRIELSRPGGRAAALEAARRFASRTSGTPGLDEAIAGLLAEDANDPEAAAALYRKSLAADPSRVLAADRVFAIERLPAAASLEPTLRRALARDARIDEYHNLLGMILVSRGRLDDALGEFRTASDLDPDNAQFAANLAGSLARLGRWTLAAEAYERAAALEPSAANFMKLGSVYRRLNRPEQALALFERARSAGGAGSGALLGIALSHRDLRQIPEAMAAVREGLDRFPGDPGLRSLYDELVRTTGNRGSAPGPPGSGS